MKKPSILKKSSASPASPSAVAVAKPKPVPMLDLSRQYSIIREEISAAVQRVCDSQQYILGPEVTAFEAESAQFLGVKHSLGCASGTDALWLSLSAGGVGPGDEVITTPFSFFATASSIVRTGARPVFVDILPTTLNIDPAAVAHHLEGSHSSKVKAIMPVHLYGQCADIDGITSIATRYKLAVVEDAAQAFGAAWRGRRAGVLGTVAAFSFYPTKNLSCFGDGGLVTTNDEALAGRVRLLRNHGSAQRYFHEEIGWNSRLDSIQAAVLRVKLKYIEKWNKQRRERALNYQRLLKSAGLLEPATPKSKPNIRLLADSENSFHIYHQFVILTHRRDELRTFLAGRSIGSEIYYPVPLHLQKCFAYLGHTVGDFPESEKAAQEVLALPVYPELTNDEQAAVVEAIAAFYS